MEFTFQSSFGQQYRASLSVLRRAPIQLVGALFFPAAGAYLIYTLLSTGRGITPGDVCLFVLLFAFPFGLTALNVWLFRRRNRAAEGPYIIAVDEAGMHVRNPVVEAHFKWSAIRKIVETPRYFLFFMSPMMAQFVPKSAIGGIENESALRSFIHDLGIPFKSKAA